MKELRDRRYNRGLPQLTQLWTGVWVLALILFAVLWVTDAPAQYYDREQPYRGWHADMEAHEQRQIELMEMQEQRARHQELERNYQENLENARRYNEKLRSGEW